MGGHVHGKLEAAPDTQFVEYAPEMVLNHLFAGTDDPPDFAIGHAFPYENGDLDFLRGEAFAWGHDGSSCFLKRAVASLTRLRPSRMPARRNSVRRCCFTVRGL